MDASRARLLRLFGLGQAVIGILFGVATGFVIAYSGPLAGSLNSYADATWCGSDQARIMADTIGELRQALISADPAVEGYQKDIASIQDITVGVMKNLPDQQKQIIQLLEQAKSLTKNLGAVGSQLQGWPRHIPGLGDDIMSTGQDLERTAGLANGKLNEMVISIGPMLDEARNQHKQLQASIRNTQTALNESHQVVRGLVEKQLPVAVHDLRQISNDLAAASKDLRELKRMVTWACITMVFASLVIVANGVTVILVGKASSP